MKVRLLKNVFEAGGVKCSRRRKQADGTHRVEVPFVKGAIIEMSEASGAKYIANGRAERYVEPADDLAKAAPTSDKVPE